jgi:glutamate synthase domain-containing protein 2/glutamate synthase domain-containing protein 1/glutamate synthase domain-containing protein 3
MFPTATGLYDPRSEHDACGFGFICHMKGTETHDIVRRGLDMLENMNHRGASGSEPDSGDGAGIMVATPDVFFRRRAAEIGFELPPRGEYAVGMLFLPRDVKERRRCEQVLTEVVEAYDMTVLGWRDVPTNNSFLGPTARASEPKIRQAFIGMTERFYRRDDFNQRLYLVRQQVENIIEFGTDWPAETKATFYINLMSTNRMVYKGMLTAHQLRAYYPDLADPAFVSPFSVVHSRFSTNTFPSWRLAQPFRYVAHNGEINTIRGNKNWMRSRYGALDSKIFGKELEKLFPIVSDAVSDSATLDNALQFLRVNDRELAHAVLMLIPEAWQNNDLMDPDQRAFYEYHAMMMEPWDGPAGIAFCDGEQIGAVLDRNGLRPARYWVTHDDLLIMGSEAGCIPIEPENVKKKWRLQPGKMLLCDFTKQKDIIDDEQIKQHLVEMRPWRKWVDSHMLTLDDLPTIEPAGATGDLLKQQHAFGYTTEDLRMILYPMAAAGAEATGSMGADTPLAVLSDKPQLLFNYFKQLFAQVTNPPLDAIREELVTSLYTWLGREGNLIGEEPEYATMLKLRTPILTDEQLAKIKALDSREFRPVTLDTTFDARGGEEAMERSLDELLDQAAIAVDQGATLVILSDRKAGEHRCAIPALLATSAVHHHLIRCGTRTQAGLIVETAEAREGHHFCCLLGYGAGAINPYLALRTVQDLHAEGLLPDPITPQMARKNYVKAAGKAILKVASKMGISTVQSYRGAQIFEAIGLGQKLVDKHFAGTVSRLGGVGLDTLAAEALARHRRAYPPMDVEPSEVLEAGGFYQWRRDGEYHAWNPGTVASLQKAVRLGSRSDYDRYAKLLNDESARTATIRGLMTFEPIADAVPLDEVEPAKEIVKRFATGAMSFGSISKEAHETLALAMNELGGKSNSGEGGEDPDRFQPLNVLGKRSTNPRRSAIKQIASGRFGVTAEYLSSAEQLQIKVAQGAKPGEGGALSGQKVDEYIAQVRHSTPGVGLISPPPHHDIYSIEDLAQLIHDLKNANPAADVSVKLVSEVGIGTVAAGVAKAKADHIVISGYSGGTGNAALSSIKHTGLPWELGLAETQQTLVMNGLRGRVRLQADGGMKTGRDVVIAALLGAEEVGFSTAPLIATGCIMMRVCHLNTCPVGIATQDPELRAKFKGTPEQVINYMFFVAEEVRELMASLGFRTFDEMVGRADCLGFRDVSAHPKANQLNLDAILRRPEVRPGDSPRKTQVQDHGIDRALDNTLIELADEALEDARPVKHALPIRNINRTTGTMLSGEVAKRYGHAGLPEGTIHFKFTGSAGQSFGAYLARGITLEVEGDVNDYLGKGLSGGRIVAYPPKEATFKPEENIIAGNVIAYGGISGEIFLRGVVGERFCVRNSGVTAVVEGTGDHGCEYMTGGRVIVLGPTGRNFAAGMSGGVAYVYDLWRDFESKCNTELVDLEPVPEDDYANFKAMLEQHATLTGSQRARYVLDNFPDEVARFVRVMPVDYRRVIEHRKEIEARAAELAEEQV